MKRCRMWVAGGGELEVKEGGLTAEGEGLGGFAIGVRRVMWVGKES